MLCFIDYPSFLKPEIFGFLNLKEGNFLNIFRWYALSYIAAFGIAYLQGLYLLKTDKFKLLNKKIIDDYFFYCIISLVLGGRIFSCLIYEFNYYKSNPIEILFPFHDGNFIGFQGMAYHGAVIGVFVFSLIYVIIKKLNFRELCDFVFPIIPLGYTLGRLANFANQELFGRVTSSPLGVLFPLADKVPVNDVLSASVINKLGWTINDTALTITDKSGNIFNNLLENLNGNIFINLPRHPSQLYEAFFEGLVLFFFVWFIGRKFKPFKGFLASIYLGGYAIFRFFIEFLRQPDSQFADPSNGKNIGYIIGSFSMGQILCFIMLLFAIFLAFYFRYLSKMDIIHEEQNKNLKRNKKHKK